MKDYVNKKLNTINAEQARDKVCLTDDIAETTEAILFATISPVEYSEFVRTQSQEKNISTEFKLRRIKDAISEYVTMLGGYPEIPENDEIYNSFNFDLMNTIKNGYGTAYIGRMINSSNNNNEFEEILTEYKGQNISPFSYDYVIPVRDKELENLMKRWHKSEDGKSFRKILKRVNYLGGVFLSWA